MPALILSQLTTTRVRTLTVVHALLQGVPVSLAVISDSFTLY